MPAASLRIHGGSPPPCCHDFSAPANPLGPPAWLGELLEECMARRVHLRYPSPGLEELREAIAWFHRADPRMIVVVNGAAEALAVLPLLLHAERLVVVEPGFGDHGVQAPAMGLGLARVVMERGGEGFTIDEARVLEAAEEGSVVVLSRPSNPTGYLAPADLLADLARRLAERGSWLVVDEAFIDLSPGAEPLEPGPGLVVVRSLTKTFASPGLRLGYIYAEEWLARKLDGARQPWPVGGLEACVYPRLLHDPRSRDYVARGRELAALESRRLARRLAEMGLRVYPSRAPFLLLGHPWLPHPAMQEALTAQGVYVRDASSFHGLGPGYSRVSIRTPGENDVLLRAFERALEGG
ncbi:hypothetical protein CF15_04595 [Pyrodictium occultum]|uniref:Aminotransferase class I/classII large domain-containing protein n=1 Tax=Pyrodictium occultum TaxID=2309 RepID=A0A0V8RVI7_PYROC|nr:aminotransferase class I/II-fold pyridoxal phosphate-dependent enzyme [Pyrodictium occultum]KSW12062.1 hypothetical protein CF15_04595 [Pyrodictium occultum]